MYFAPGTIFVYGPELRAIYFAVPDIQKFPSLDLFKKMSSGGSNRFASLSEEQLNCLVDEKDSVSTKNSTKYAVNVFRQYLKEKNESEEFESCNREELDTLLRSFYAELRNSKGNLYKKTSLQSIRTGISRHLGKINGFDLMKDSSFKKSNEMFLTVCKLTTKEGLGDVVHKSGIESADIERLYLSRVFCVKTPTGLLNKVLQKGVLKTTELAFSQSLNKSDSCGQ